MLSVLYIVGFLSVFCITIQLYPGSSSCIVHVIVFARWHHLFRQRFENSGGF